MWNGVLWGSGVLARNTTRGLLHYGIRGSGDAFDFRFIITVNILFYEVPFSAKQFVDLHCHIIWAVIRSNYLFELFIVIKFLRFMDNKPCRKQNIFS